MIQVINYRQKGRSEKRKKQNKNTVTQPGYLHIEVSFMKESLNTLKVTQVMLIFN